MRAAILWEFATTGPFVRPHEVRVWAAYPSDDQTHVVRQQCRLVHDSNGTAIVIDGHKLGERGGFGTILFRTIEDTREELERVRSARLAFKKGEIRAMPQYDRPKTASNPDNTRELEALELLANALSGPDEPKQTSFSVPSLYVAVDTVTTDLPLYLREGSPLISAVMSVMAGTNAPLRYVASAGEDYALGWPPAMLSGNIVAIDTDDELRITVHSAAGTEMVHEYPVFARPLPDIVVGTEVQHGQALAVPKWTLQPCKPKSWEEAKCLLGSDLRPMLQTVLHAHTAMVNGVSFLPTACLTLRDKLPIESFLFRVDHLPRLQVFSWNGYRQLQYRSAQSELIVDLSYNHKRVYARQQTREKRVR